MVLKPNDTLNIPYLNINIGIEDISEQTVLTFRGVHINYKLHWHEYILYMKTQVQYMH